MGYTWRLIATTAPLMWSLLVVVLHKGVGHGAHVFQRRRTMHLQAFFFVAAMVTLHIGIEARATRWQDIGLNPNTIEKLTQGRRKIACSGAASPRGYDYKNILNDENSNDENVGNNF